MKRAPPSPCSNPFFKFDHKEFTRVGRSSGNRTNKVEAIIGRRWIRGTEKCLIKCTTVLN